MKICCHPNDLLRKAGIEITRHRISVLKIILDFTKATPAKKILQGIRESNSIDKVTLYRILELFVQKNILRRITNLNGIICYEIVCHQHHPIHPHLVCRACGEVECLSAFDLKITKQFNLWKRTWGAEDIDVRLAGLCIQCKEK